MPKFPTVAGAGLAAAVALIAACKADSASGPGDKPTVSIASSSVTLLGIGATTTINAAVTPSGATASWASDAPTIATVAGSATSATITAVSGGSTTVRVTVTSGSESASATVAVTVTPVVRSVTIEPSQLTIMVGEERTLTPTVVADQGASQALTWTSEPATIVDVDAQGRVTGIAPGTATVRATSVATPSVFRTVQITVTALPQVTSVTVSPDKDTLLIGATRTLTATVVADATLSKNVTWRTSTPAVATVNGSGVVSAVSPAM